MCVCRTEQTKGWIEGSRVKVRADILSSGELKHKNTSLCSLCAQTALPLPPLNMPSYPLIELHPDSTFDHRGEATITHNEYSHLITRCWKYSSHNLAISQSNGSFLGANALNSATIQIDRAGGTANKKKRAPSSAFSLQVRETNRQRFFFQLTSNCRQEKEKWLNTHLHTASTAVLLCQCCCSTIPKIPCVYFSPDDVKLMNRHSFLTLCFFFFVFFFWSTHCTHTPTVRRNWYIVLFFWLFCRGSSIIQSLHHRERGKRSFTPQSLNTHCQS